MKVKFMNQEIYSQPELSPGVVCGRNKTLKTSLLDRSLGSGPARQSTNIRAFAGAGERRSFELHGFVLIHHSMWSSLLATGDLIEVTSITADATARLVEDFLPCIYSISSIATLTCQRAELRREQCDGSSRSSQPSASNTTPCCRTKPLQSADDNPIRTGKALFRIPADL